MPLVTNVKCYKNTRKVVKCVGEFYKELYSSGDRNRNIQRPNNILENDDSADIL